MFQQKAHSQNKQHDITIEHPTPYKDTYGNHPPTTVHISPTITLQTHQQPPKHDAPTNNFNIFQQIARDTKLKILTPTEYIRLQYNKSNNKNTQTDNVRSKESSEPY